jgi:hypothetical protein
MEPTTVFLKPSFQIAVQPATGELAVQVAAARPPPVTRPLAVVAPPRWLTRR